MEEYLQRLNILDVIKCAWKLKVMENNNEIWKDRKVIKQKIQVAETERAFTALEKRLLERKRCYKKRITRKKEREGHAQRWKQDYS